MKKFLKIFLAFIITIIVALFAIPYFYKDKIIAFVKKDINNSLNATVDFKDVDLSLFRNFPNLNLKLNQLTVDGIETFKGVRLLDAENFNLTLDIKSVLGGDQIKIKRIGVEDAALNILVDEFGKANYDIVKPGDSKDEPANFNIDLKSYQVKNSNVIFDDKSMGFKTEIIGLNHKGSGKLTDEIYQLKTKSTVDTLTITYGNIKYLNRVKAEIDTDLDISGDYSKYTLKNTKALINDLPIEADGFVELKEDEIVMDINYKTENANIAQLLSLIPKEYMPDLKGVKTSGVAQLSGFVKGHSTETEFPGFKLLIDVKDASIQYPDLPEKIDNINVLTNVEFKGGSDLNTMIVDLSKMQFDIAGSRVVGNLNIKQPMTDPYISAEFKSKLDFAKVKKAVKFEQIKDLSGMMDADITFSGLVSAISNQQTDKINAKGFFNLANFTMKSDAFEQTIQIPIANMNLTPSSLKIDKFNSTIGSNDISLNGALTNYLAYALGKNEILKGEFTSNSKSLNLNDFMTESNETDTKESEKNTSENSGVIKVPKNVDVIFNFYADNVKYQKLDLKNLNGILKVANQEVKLSDMNMEMLGGKVKLNGFYNTAGEIAKTNVSVGLDQFGIKESVTSFDMFNSFAPVLNNLSGKFFSNLDINVDLDENMKPILNSIDAKGIFKSDEIFSNGINIMKKIVEVLKINELLNPKINKLNASFTIKDGTLTIKPNEFEINGMKAGIGGTFDLEKNLNLVLSLDVPKDKLGTNFNSVLSNLAGAANKLDLGKDIGETVKTKFLITGTALNPKIKPVLLGNSGQALTETMTEVVQTKVENVKNDALEKAKLEGDKLIALAQTQKEKLVLEAEKLAQETRDKAKLAGDEILKKAGDNPLKKLAAQATSDKLVKEGDKKALQIIETANKKGDELIQVAQNQSDELLQKATETKK